VILDGTGLQALPVPFAAADRPRKRSLAGTSPW